MKILGINGSPRTGGNTDVLLEIALSRAKENGAEVEKVMLNKMNISGCQECENARTDGSCIVSDDMQLLYGKIYESNVIILASPVFFGSLTAQTKTMIDRFECVWTAKYIHKTIKIQTNKVGAFICVSASGRKDFFENAKSIVKNFFVTVGVGYKEELWCTGVDEKAKIFKKPDCLKKAGDMGNKLALEEV